MGWQKLLLIIYISLPLYNITIINILIFWLDTAKKILASDILDYKSEKIKGTKNLPGQTELKILTSKRSKINFIFTSKFLFQLKTIRNFQSPIEH